MEYEPEILVPDIDNHVFSNKGITIDDDGADDEEQEISMEISGVMTRPCLMDLVEVGWNNLKVMNVNKVRMVTDEQTPVLQGSPSPCASADTLFSLTRA